MAVLSIIGEIVSKVAGPLMRANEKKFAKDQLKMFEKQEKKAVKDIEQLNRQYAKDKDKKAFKNLKKVISAFVHLTMAGYDITKLARMLENAMAKADPPDRTAIENELKKAFEWLFKKTGVKDPVFVKTTATKEVSNTGLVKSTTSSTGIDVMKSGTAVQKTITEQINKEGGLTIVQAAKVVTGEIKPPATGGIAGGVGVDYKVTDLKTTNNKTMAESTQLDTIKTMVSTVVTFAKKYWYITLPVLAFLAYKLYKKFRK